LSAGRAGRIPAADGHLADEVEPLRSARGSRGNSSGLSTGREKYGGDGVELRNDSQMVFLNSSAQGTPLARSGAPNPNSFAAMERVAEMTVELQDRDEQVARLKDLIDRQAEQLREYEVRAQEAERLMHRARTDLQKERQLRASAELRQRDLMRQLQEQERELARSLRRGEYTKGLEDKVAELEDKLSNSGSIPGSRDSSLMESVSEVSRSEMPRPRPTRPRPADTVSRTSSQASSVAGSRQGSVRDRPSSRSVSSASVSSVQSGTSSVRAELRKKLELSGPNKTMRAKRVEFRHLCEIKGLGNPPTPVRLLMQVMCILFSIPPARKRDDQNRPYEDYWEVAKKKLLADPYFCTKLHHFPRPLSDELRAKNRAVFVRP
jgi:hypothetical protein